MGKNLQPVVDLTTHILLHPTSFNPFPKYYYYKTVKIISHNSFTNLKC